MKSKVSTFKQYLALALCAVLALSSAPVYAATTGSIRVGVNVNESATVDNGTATFTLSDAIVRTFTNGTGSDQASKIYQDTVSLAGSGTSTIDLDSTLTCNIGTCSFTRIYAIIIQRTDLYAASTQDENLTIGGDFILTKYLTAWVDDALTVSMGPAGAFVAIFPGPTGIAVTASTGDQLTIVNASSADTVAFKVYILGS